MGSFCSQSEARCFPPLLGFFGVAASFVLLLQSEECLNDAVAVAVSLVGRPCGPPFPVFVGGSARS